MACRVEFNAAGAPHAPFGLSRGDMPQQGAEPRAAAREDIERLADGIDFSACSAVEINVDKYRYYTRHEARGAESWMYVNAFGDTVCCVDAGWGSSLVIYETPQAYVVAISFGTERTDTAPGAAGGGDYAAERLADSIEFSKLK